MEPDYAPYVLAAISFLAAAVNGGLGYGFSSITVPVALLFVANRVLNPALVLVELVVNAACLVVFRRSIPKVWRRVLPMLGGLLPGVLFGSFVLATVPAGPLKLVTFALLLPLIVLQSAGFRRPVRNEALAGVPVGAAVGALYAATTVSGPPLALVLNNQGLAKDEFRAALALFRTAEAICTAVAYFAIGLFALEEARALAWAILPVAATGLGAGYLLLRHVEPETFRRVCMALDAVLVGFGLARVGIEFAQVPPAVAWISFAFVVAVEAWIVARFLIRRPRVPVPVPAPSLSAFPLVPANGAER